MGKCKIVLFFLYYLLVHSVFGAGAPPPRVETPDINPNRIKYEFTSTTGQFVYNKCIDWIDVSQNLCREWRPIPATHDELYKRGFLAVPASDVLK